MSNPQSAIDEIFELSKKMSEMLEKISVIEKNIKSLNNKFIILTKKVDSISVDPEDSAKDDNAVTGTPNALAPGARPQVVQSQQNDVTNNKLVLGSVKTYGYIMSESRKPIPDIFVSIYDSSGDKVRSLKTNSDGYWEARLPSSDYKVVYSHVNFNDVEKNISIPKGSTNFRVI